jgi:hypothetical protein
MHNIISNKKKEHDNTSIPQYALKDFTRNWWDFVWFRVISWDSMELYGPRSIILLQSSSFNDTWKFFIAVRVLK